MKRILSICLLLFCYTVQAQTTDSTIVHGKKITFTTGVIYNSSLNYFGRTDSLKSQGIVPFAGISLKNGIYLFSQFIFINNALTTTYAATALEAGYRFQNKAGSFKGNVFGTGYFYQEDVSLVQSVVKQQAGINLSALTKIINIHTGADAKFSNQVDFGVYTGIDHIFRFDSIGKGAIVIAPTAYAYFGTQRFSKTYLQQKRFLFFPVGEETVTKSSSAFNTLSYELSCSFVYGIGKMNIVVTPSYVLPQHVIATDGTPQQASNLFYTTAAIRFDL